MSNLRIIKNIGPFSQLTYAGFRPGNTNNRMNIMVVKTQEGFPMKPVGNDSVGKIHLVIFIRGRVAPFGTPLLRFIHLICQRLEF